MTKIRDQKLLKQFGKRLKEMRLAKEYSQQALADYSDIPKIQIGRIERGEINPTLSTISAIAKALDIKMVDMLEGL